MRWADIHSLIGDRHGTFDCACPTCGPHRQSRANQVRKVLRIWRDADDFASYSCARCGIQGYVKSDGIAREARRDIEVSVAEPSKDRADLARFLWSRSEDLAGSIGQRYFEGRALSTLPECSRFLPARGYHPPAVISRFGDSGTVQSVHLIKLSSDGSRKAGGEKDKIMIGDSAGVPLIVARSESSAIGVTEGIENALSIHMAMGWEMWAAGALIRVPLLIPMVPRGATLHVEREFETPRSGVTGQFNKVTEMRPDARILKLYLAAPGKLPSAGYDANKIHQEFGIDYLRSAIAEMVSAQECVMKFDGRAFLI